MKQTFIPEDGLAYTIHLKNCGNTIYNAIYHHCTLSGKHYFAKGENVYPIEDVYKHSAKGHEIKIMNQILTSYFYGHLIQVSFTSVIPEHKLLQIPDSVYDRIMFHIKENVVEGEFIEEETGDSILIQLGNEGDEEEVYIVTAGSWRVMQFDYNTIYRIVMWWNNYYILEDLNPDLFIKYFGKEKGMYYYDKWIFCQQNLLDMFGNFVSEQLDGQTFCNMLMQLIEQYERIENNSEKYQMQKSHI